MGGPTGGIGGPIGGKPLGFGAEAGGKYLAVEASGGIVDVAEASAGSVGGAARTTGNGWKVGWDDLHLGYSSNIVFALRYVRYTPPVTLFDLLDYREQQHQQECEENPVESVFPCRCGKQR